MVGLEVGGDLCFCAIAIAEELLLVVQQLLTRLGGVLGVLSLNQHKDRDKGQIRRGSLSTMASTGQASWQNPQ